MARAEILLVEDDEVARRLYSRFLGDLDYRVVVAEDGAKAIALLHRLKPDLVLLDIMMPRLDGIAACPKIRAKVGESVPILFLTTLDDLDSVRRAIAAGGDDFIIKAGDLDAVLARVRFWTSPRTAAQAEQRRRTMLASLRRTNASVA